MNMSIIPKGNNLEYVAAQLGMSRAFATKSLRELDLERPGRGKEKIYSGQELKILGRIRVLRCCGVSWDELREIKSREEKAFKAIDKHVRSFISKPEVFDDSNKSTFAEIQFFFTGSLSIQPSNRSPG